MSEMPIQPGEAGLGTTHVCGIVRYTPAVETEDRSGPAREWRGGLAYMRCVPLLIDFESPCAFEVHPRIIEP